MISQPAAIIDIGSNSVRLVVYDGPRRIPAIIFNEKVMAGLGRGVARTGELSEAGQDRALKALRRFHILTRQMEVSTTRVVATAAVREATNGQAFLEKVRDIGFTPEILTGEQEGQMAGYGVLSGIPEADGIVGDLGGGSLELVDVAAGRILGSASIPFGVLRLPALLDKGEAVFVKRLAKALEPIDFRRRGRRRPFYMVGGSWRALSRFDMVRTRHPLPVSHHHILAPDRIQSLRRELLATDKDRLKDVPALSSSRIPTLPNAALLLEALVEELRPSELVTSSFGIREGMLYERLDPATRRLDPLIEAARQAGRGLGRFPEHGDLLDKWIAPVFADPPHLARLRRAACVLSDIAWQAHPDFRADRGLDMALHGNWVGIDAPGRVLLAQALYTNFGGKDFASLEVARLCAPEDLRRATLWGLAIRLGHRFSGGVATSLERSRLGIRSGMLRLEIRRGDEALFGDAVERRLDTLATGLGLGAEAVVM